MVFYMRRRRTSGIGKFITLLRKNFRFYLFSTRWRMQRTVYITRLRRKFSFQRLTNITLLAILLGKFLMLIFLIC